MTDYLVSIIRPKGYVHSACFSEVAETLQYALRHLGHKSAILENIVDPRAANIVLGAHLLTPSDMSMLPTETIIYNLEQLGSEHLSDAYYELADKYQIWDYSPLNIDKWRQRECAFIPQLVEIGYVPELRRIPAEAAQDVEQDIDVLFYGSVNEHRLNILKQLQDAGVKVHPVFGVYGKERDALIARSKLVLNVHFYATNLFEIVRVSYLLANSKAVVSEMSPDIGEMQNAVAAFEYDALVEGCLDLLRNEEKRKALERRGFEIFSRRNAAHILAGVLPKQPENAGINELRRLYLDMVQKCIINVIYEDPNQDYWSPHQFHSQLRELGRDWPSQAHSMIGNARMTNLRNLIELVIEEGIPGDFIETGVWRGGACIMMRAVLKAYGIEDRQVWVADSFCGLPEPNPDVPADAGDVHHTFAELAISLEEVRSNFAKYGLLDSQVQFLKGWFSETLPHAPIKQLAVLRLDGDMYESTMDALENLYEKVSVGGFIIVDDFGAVPACQRAIFDFREQRGIADPLQPIDGRGVYWRKTAASAQKTQVEMSLSV
jgi:O-methyltransferase/8-demethyl-8-(2,3-dimethoxy-alpha-L-rhamnosyl)tetracenomycin-C 4'-O-methyltransferase